MYINRIKINKIRNLKDLVIDLGTEKKHLILTGKNGSGKTTLLTEISEYLQKIKNKEILGIKKLKDAILHYENNLKKLSHIRTPDEENEYQKYKRWAEEDAKTLEELTKLKISFSDLSLILEKLNKNEFIIKYFKTKRSSKMVLSNGVERIDLNDIKSDESDSQSWFLKYMVHLKTQLAYSISDKDQKEIEKLQKWFDRFEQLLRTIFETNNIKLIYDRKNYNFTLKENEKEFDFLTLSDGFSAVIEIITGIMMGMEKDEKELHNYDMDGIVMIDELDTHLHISLQRKIFKVLTDFFPNIQFIITTHSPFILNSVENVIIYDLEKKIIEEDMSLYTYDAISEIYFGATSHSEILLEQISKYEFLIKKENKTLEEEGVLKELEEKFNNIDHKISEELTMKIWNIKGLK